MLVIDKLTQSYDRAEDRISIDVQDASGRVLRMWLTRRLGDALFGHLGQLLAAAGVGRDAEFARHLQVWEQQAAQAQLRGDEPVRWQGEAVLLGAVDLSRIDQGMQLIFKAPLAGVDRPVARVTLGDVHLRQWLGIVFQLYGAAGWPRDAWPHWFVEAQQASTDSASPAAGLH
jgi:hypothetical protein